MSSNSVPGRPLPQPLIDSEPDPSTYSNSASQSGGVQAEPMTHEDLKSIVNLHMICFTENDNFAMRLGPEFLFVTYRFFLDDPKSFGFVVKHSDEVIGALVGRLDYYTTALNRYRMMTAIKAVATHPMLMLDKRFIGHGSKITFREFFSKKQAATVKRARSHSVGGTATLASFCTHPDYRQLKINDILLATAETFCRERGMLYLRAGVRHNNTAARFVYRRRGYKEDCVLGIGDSLLYYLPLATNVDPTND